jgi:hypothetical protein
LWKRFWQLPYKSVQKGLLAVNFKKNTVRGTGFFLIKKNILKINFPLALPIRK